MPKRVVVYIQAQKYTLGKEQKVSTSKGIRYRLIIIDDETLEKLRSLRISKRAIFAIASLVVLGISILTASLIYLTPLKTTVPGYAEFENNPEFQEISRQVDRMSTAMEAQSSYIAQLQQLISGTPAEILDSISAADDLDLGILNDYEDYEQVDNQSPTTQSSRPISINEILFIKPVQGTISADFLESREHLGIDIVCPLNSPVKSTLPGYVIVADWTMKTGHTIGVQHSDGLVSFYKHNNALLKHVGDYVLGGEVIAMTGNTGDLTDGPHLHFELWRSGKPIDPSRYISW